MIRINNKRQILGSSDHQKFDTVTKKETFSGESSFESVEKSIEIFVPKLKRVTTEKKLSLNMEMNQSQKHAL